MCEEMLVLSDIHVTKIPSTSSSCFTQGSKVFMFDGTLKAIEEIIPGDEVRSCFLDGPNIVLLKDI